MHGFGYRNRIYSKAELPGKPGDTDYFLPITMG